MAPRRPQRRTDPSLPRHKPRRHQGSPTAPPNMSNNALVHQKVQLTCVIFDRRSCEGSMSSRAMAGWCPTGSTSRSTWR
eukprot:1027455-Rhodomonas_salina.1